jgi:anti-sigma regulatory factor (Ser/Thr protein kinase)
VSSFEETCEVREALDVFHARRRVRELCSSVGFPRQAALELELVASELCTNILKYGVRGSLHVRHACDPDRGVFVEIVARDEGPPFHDLESALRDGCDDRGPIDPGALTRRGGLGTGLGTVMRFTHTLTVDEDPMSHRVSQGKRITVRRYACQPLE